MTTDNFCFYLQSRLIQTSQTGGQWYSDTSPFGIPRKNLTILCEPQKLSMGKRSSLIVPAVQLVTKVKKNLQD